MIAEVSVCARAIDTCRGSLPTQAMNTDRTEEILYGTVNTRESKHKIQNADHGGSKSLQVTIRLEMHAD